MSSVVVLSTPLLEGASADYEFQLDDGAGNPIALADLQTLTLTYYDQTTLTVVNGREDQDVLNANDVEVSGGGTLHWFMQVEDAVLVDSRHGTEPHVALFTWTWDDGTEVRTARHAVQFTLEAVPLG